ncbi:MAG: DNA mismatch endonuclease Vsr [Gemmatimonadetes bacterium]|nr:DNA mismatch endonuclease Vsr [Gemmatimonadota bacterium]
MTDIVDRATRSKMMSGIRGKDTKPGLLVRRYLHRAGLRYRLHAKALPGRPDLVLTRYRTVIQVHGCFWHRHRGCRYAYFPSSNVPFWRAKFFENTSRDRRNDRKLRALGWKVLTIWECEASKPQKLAGLLDRIREKRA